MPTGTKAIKDGGWLAHNSGNSRIYGSRGNKQLDFFAYDPAGDSWSRRANWLLGTEGKPPSKGSAGCADGAGIIYATKGNSRQGFHAYYANGDSWRQKKDVPLGLSNKNVKGGTDIVWAYKGAVGSPYLLKGLKNEFYRYDVAGDSWQTLSPAPVGGNVKWDKGSWLAYDDANKKIYAHKAKYHEFYRYDVESGLWSGALAAMPIPGSAGSKKSKDGGCGTYVNGSVFALKGGGTVEFWKYDLAGDSWGERTSMPLGTAGKRAKSGADVVTDGTVLYATKGNKSNEFWMYTPDALWLMRHAVGDGLTAGRVAMDDCRIVTIAPNPLAAGFATVRLSSRRAPFSLRIYDAAGRCVQSAVCSPGPEMALDVRCLRPGVYLVRLSGQGFAESQKLVVQR
jgi:hypothetical protein